MKKCRKGNRKRKKKERQISFNWWQKENKDRGKETRKKKREDENSKHWKLGLHSGDSDLCGFYEQSQLEDRFFKKSKTRKINIEQVNEIWYWVEKSYKDV
jgi:hypothetical protein